MSNSIHVGNDHISLTDEQAAAIVAALRELNVVGKKKKQLFKFEPGEVVKIGGFEMVVLEQYLGETALICKNFFKDESKFSETNNNYAGSTVDCLCETFADQLAEAIGRENILEHPVDLTTMDGLKDYGTITRRASLLTMTEYRRFVDVLDKHKQDEWWWLATATSTKNHENDRWALCVSPSGYFSGDGYGNGDSGVRPFCILKSDIFVSFEE